MDGESWIRIDNFNPFRNTYFYWDKKEKLIDAEFELKNVKVKKKKIIFTHNEHPYIGSFLTCKRRDAAAVEKILNHLNERIKIIDGQRYNNFLIQWRMNLLKAKNDN